MLEMLERSGIMTAPGAGTVFLVVILLFLFIRKKIVNSRKESSDAVLPQAGVIAPIQASGETNAAAITAAIVAAVTEYRKQNS